MDTENLISLKNLSFKKKLTFAYLTCERLFGNYVFFYNNFNFGSPDKLKNAIMFLHDNLFENRPEKQNIEKIIKQVEKITPDTEHFSTIYVSSALDACTCSLDSLDALLEMDFSTIENISTYGIDTVDMYVREIEEINANDKLADKKVNLHPLMQKEVTIQHGIITFLNNRRDIDYADVETLLQLQDNNKRSCLDL
ncbi:MAG: DUF416 family protein [Filimonas sp.]|nr:DUF416 family protein [Filimonas sp.]